MILMVSRTNVSDRKNKCFVRKLDPCPRTWVTQNSQSSKDTKTNDILPVIFKSSEFPKIVKISVLLYKSGILR